jgi:hypothetical protein
LRANELPRYALTGKGFRRVFIPFLNEPWESVMRRVFREELLGELKRQTINIGKKKGIDYCWEGTNGIMTLKDETLAIDIWARKGNRRDK